MTHKNITACFDGALRLLCELEMARDWCMDELLDGKVCIDEFNRQRIINLDESNISLDGALVNDGGWPSFTIWNPNKSRPGGARNKSSFRCTLVVA
jgi:hypothetical protein